MIQLEKSSIYWWEKTEAQAQKIVSLCNSAPANMIRTERETLVRMCDQLERYNKAEVRHKIRRFYNV